MRSSPSIERWSSVAPGVSAPTARNVKAWGNAQVGVNGFFQALKARNRNCQSKT